MNIFVTLLSGAVVITAALDSNHSSAAEVSWGTVNLPSNVRGNYSATMRRYEGELLDNTTPHGFGVLSERICWSSRCKEARHEGSFNMGRLHGVVNTYEDGELAEVGTWTNGDKRGGRFVAYFTRNPAGRCGLRKGDVMSIHQVSAKENAEGDLIEEYNRSCEGIYYLARRNVVRNGEVVDTEYEPPSSGRSQPGLLGQFAASLTEAWLAEKQNAEQRRLSLASAAAVAKQSQASGASSQSIAPATVANQPTDSQASNLRVEKAGYTPPKKPRQPTTASRQQSGQPAGTIGQEAGTQPPGGSLRSNCVSIRENRDFSGLQIYATNYCGEPINVNICMYISNRSFTGDRQAASVSANGSAKFEYFATGEYQWRYKYRYCRPTPGSNRIDTCPAECPGA